MLPSAKAVKWSNEKDLILAQGSHKAADHMLPFPKVSGWAATGEAVRLMQDADSDTLWVGRSCVRRVLFCGVVLTLLLQEVQSLSSGRSLQLRSSPQLPQRSSSGWSAFLTAPRLPQFCSWAAGNLLPLCRRSPWIPHAAPQRVLLVALVSRDITSSPLNMTLHASGGPVRQPPCLFPFPHKFALFAVVLCDPASVFFVCISAFPHPGEEQDTSAQVSKHDVKWNQRLAELRRFKKVNGGKVDVSQGNREWLGLGMWCSQQVRPSPPHDR